MVTSSSRDYSIFQMTKAKDPAYIEAKKKNKWKEKKEEEENEKEKEKEISFFTQSPPFV